MNKNLKSGLESMDVDLVIFTNADLVIGHIFTGVVGKEMGQMTIAHGLREQFPDAEDCVLLENCTTVGFITCWDDTRAAKAVQELHRNSSKEWNVRIYSLPHRVM